MRKRRSMLNLKEKKKKQEARNKAPDEKILRLRELINNKDYLNMAIEGIADKLTDALSNK